MCTLDPLALRQQILSIIHHAMSRNAVISQIIIIIAQSPLNDFTPFLQEGSKVGAIDNRRNFIFAQAFFTSFFSLLG